MPPRRSTRSVHVRTEPPPHDGAVRVPVLPVLLLARLLISLVAVHEQHAEINDVKIRHDVAEPARQAPRPRHEPIAEVVDVPRHAPPPGDQQTRAARGREVLQVLHRRVVRVLAETILLPVAAAEHDVSDDLDRHDEAHEPRLERDVVLEDVSRLERVRERHPHEVAEREHESEAVRGDVHGRENGGLEPQRVEDVYPLERAHERHRGGDASGVQELLMREPEVEEEPTDQARGELAKDFQVESAAQKTRVQLSPDEKVVQRVPAVAALGEELLLADERPDVQREGERERERDARGEQRREIRVHPSEMQSPAPHANAHARRGRDEDGQPVELVRQPLAVREDHALLLRAREDQVCRDRERHPA
mmetsp:Transcript_8209/g.29984  ORF Transcript_8209/g.29984 Transcript_8209/m.29984 type:complete len:364 (-) Transcript_8209:421-1512(-)